MQQLHRDTLMSTRDDLMSLSDIVLCLYKWPTDAPPWMCISLPCSYYREQMLYIHKYSFRIFMYINRVKRNVGMVTCQRAFLPLAWHLLEHTAAPSVTLNRNKWHRFKTPGSFHFCSSKVFKSFDVTRNGEQGSYPALVVNMCIHGYIYPNLYAFAGIHWPFTRRE